MSGRAEIRFDTIQFNSIQFNSIQFNRIRFIKKKAASFYFNDRFLFFFSVLNNESCCFINVGLSAYLPICLPTYLFCIPTCAPTFLHTYLSTPSYLISPIIFPYPILSSFSFPNKFMPVHCHSISILNE
jgi:hypothetical protein